MNFLESDEAFARQLQAQELGLPTFSDTSPLMVIQLLYTIYTSSSLIIVYLIEPLISCFKYKRYSYKYTSCS